MIAAQVPAAATTELCSRLVASFLMLFQFFGTAKASNIAYLDFLARLRIRIESVDWSGRCRRTSGRSRFLLVFCRAFRSILRLCS